MCHREVHVLFVLRWSLEMLMKNKRQDARGKTLMRKISSPQFCLC